jgi:hypothetical protein
MLFNANGTKKELTIGEKLICKSGLEAQNRLDRGEKIKQHDYAAIAARINLLAPLREKHWV